MCGKNTISVTTCDAKMASLQIDTARRTFQPRFYFQKIDLIN